MIVHQESLDKGGRVNEQACKWSERANERSDRPSGPLEKRFSEIRYAPLVLLYGIVKLHTRNLTNLLYAKKKRKKNLLKFLLLAIR